MEREQSVVIPVATGLALLALALILRGWLGALLALGALIPGGYVVWLGTQSQTQKKFVTGLAILIGALVVAALVMLGKILGFLRP